MTPEGMFPFFAAYAICTSGVIFFSLFAVTVLLGLTILDIWNASEYSQPVKVFLSVCAALFPEIGVMSWAVYFGKTRKLFSESLLSQPVESICYCRQVGLLCPGEIKVWALA